MTLLRRAVPSKTLNHLDRASLHYHVAELLGALPRSGSLSNRIEAILLAHQVFTVNSGPGYHWVLACT